MVEPHHGHGPGRAAQGLADLRLRRARPDQRGLDPLRAGRDAAHLRQLRTAASCASCSFCLGNVGIAGGGINALRGEPNVQGSTDVGASVHQAPGYLSWPRGREPPDACRLPVGMETYAAGYYSNKPKFWVSALQGMVRRQRDGRKRLLLRPAAQDQPDAMTTRTTRRS